MKVIRLSLAMLLLSCFLFSTVHADDKIEYRKEGKSTLVSGQIVEETISNIKFKSGLGKEVNISTSDLIKVTYEYPPAVRASVNAAILLDEKKDYEGALKAYIKILPDVNYHPNSSVPANRFLEYRIAFIKAQLREPDGKDALAAFVATHSNIWETWVAGKMLISLYANQNEFAKAIVVASQLDASKGLSKNMKQESEGMLIDLYLQSGKIAEAQSRIESLMKNLTPNDPLKKVLEVELLFCKSKDAKIEDTSKEINAIIDRATDPNLKAVAYLVLGDCYALKGQKREAMWQYLWVDSVYNQNPAERAKALDRLSRLFETEFKDKERAAMFREKAQKYR